MLHTCDVKPTYHQGGPSTWSSALYVSLHSALCVICPLLLPEDFVGVPNCPLWTGQWRSSIPGLNHLWTGIRVRFLRKNTRKVRITGPTYCPIRSVTRTKVGFTQHTPSFHKHLSMYRLLWNRSLSQPLSRFLGYLNRFLDTFFFLASTFKQVACFRISTSLSSTSPSGDAVESILCLPF